MLGATQSPRYSSRQWLPCAVGALALLVYVPRCFRTLAVMGDSPELVTAAIIGGVPHAPGYPLYTALGHLTTYVPFGHEVWRLHAMSAAFHAGAVAAVVDIVFGLTCSQWAALAAGVVLMFSRSFLLGSLYAEVFPLHDMLCAVTLAIGARIARTDRPPFRMLVLFAAAVGVACAHHLMAGLVLPSLLLLVGPALGKHLLPGRNRAKPAAWSMRVAVLAALLLGPFFMGYPLMVHFARAHPIVSWGEVHDWPSFVHIATRADYGGLFSASAREVSGQALERLDLYFEILSRSFRTATLLGVVGALVAARRRTRQDWAFLLAFVIPGPTFGLMNAFDIHSEYRSAYFERFTTMSHVSFAILTGLGIARVQSRLARCDWSKRMAATSGLHSRLFALLPTLCLIAPLALHLARVDFHNDRAGIAYARDLVTATPDESLILLAGDMAAQATLYECGVEKSCAHRVVFSPGQLHMAWVAHQLGRRYRYLTSILPPPGMPLSDDEIDAMVATALETRPVYLHPELVRRHPSLARRFTLVPELLLFRAYASRAAMDDDRDLQHRYEAIATKNLCAGCGATTTRAWRPSMQGQLLSAYADGLQRQARTAGALGWPAQSKQLGELAEMFAMGSSPRHSGKWWR